MKPPIPVTFTPRARREIEDCVQFVGRFPRGKPAERRDDLLRGLEMIRESPGRNPVEVRRKTGIELRKHYVRQFAIIYSWFPSDDARAGGEVSIRAVRHRRARNVFFGVREIGAPENALDPSHHRMV